jgi:hypothetical protein
MPRWSRWSSGVGPLLLLSLAIVIAAATFMLADNVDDRAVSALAVAILGICGTHAGHVVGHRLGSTADQRNDQLLALIAEDSPEALITAVRRLKRSED